MFMDLLKIFRSLGWSGMGNGTEQLSFNIFFTLVKKKEEEKISMKIGFYFSL